MTARRGLVEDERAQVRAWRRSARRRLAAAIALVPAPLVLAAALDAMVPRARLPATALGGLLAGGTCLALIAGLLIALDAGRLLRRLRGDPAAATALAFGALAVLPSGIVVRRRGAVPTRPRRVAIRTAAPPPDQPFLVPVELRTVAEPATPIQAAQRRLSAEELSELGAAATLPALVRELLPPLLYGAWVGAMVGKALDAAAGALVFAIFLFPSWRRGKARLALRADVEAGLVFRLDGPEPHEILVGSSTPWTFGGAPAPWRLRAPDASTIRGSASPG